MSCISSVKLDFKNLRVERQKYNNNIVFNAIKTSDYDTLYDNINDKELLNISYEISLNITDLLLKCVNDDITNRILSGRISKKSTRQGIIDENLQLQVCKDTAEKCGITITKLSSTEYRPTKYGSIITQREMIKNNIPKDKCLKTFDARITGKIDGWIFAKIVYGSGGHQDNVFEEADALCKWAQDYDATSFFVVLIDTNITNKFDVLVEKYKSTENILIANHYDFQEYMINHYNK